ncbi:MAG: 4-hydroxythreonine-4-phosphate dehydrogenase PdxA, partial [Candidatus Omnitrophica bacterium]|nr:4-hydroxythreonine-4-phosphate dehydrogenase PdxA [Candidatus Omnitrophota bacterium]
ILQTLLLTHRALKINFGIKKPNIAVCGLNPHAGENGLIGKEEQTIIIPALKKAKAAGVSTIGPLPADTLFSVDLGQRYDAVVAMYHDQGLIPVKTLSFTKLVNLTIGLPFIRTSPAHGTAFDIAGKGKANPDSMCEAICLAARLSS